MNRYEREAGIESAAERRLRRLTTHSLRVDRLAKYRTRVALVTPWGGEFWSHPDGSISRCQYVTGHCVLGDLSARIRRELCKPVRLP